MADGRYILLEGIDGSGTTTQAGLAAAWLRKRGLDVVETFEPTDGPVGRLIRLGLAEDFPGREGMLPEPELLALLFAADRLDHMERAVLPALAREQWVVSDRGYLSSLAYQSVECDLHWVRSLNRDVRRADLVLLLDVDAETAFRRFAEERESRDLYETVERMAAVREKYLEVTALLESEGEPIVHIDASPPADAVAKSVQRALAELL